MNMEIHGNAHGRLDSSHLQLNYMEPNHTDTTLMINEI